MFILGITDPENAKINTTLKDKPLKKEPKLEEKDCDTKVRIVVTGPKKSGKSALIERFRTDRFNEKMFSYGEQNNSLANSVHGITLGAKKIKLLVMYNNFEKLSASPSFDEKTNYDQTVVFITWNLHSPGKYEEVKLKITNERDTMQKLFPNAMFVLVGTKTDKKANTQPATLQRVATDLGFLGVARVSAKNESSKNISALFQITLNCCIEAIKAPSILQPAVAQHVNHSAFHQPAKEATAAGAARKSQHFLISPEVQRVRNKHLPLVQAYEKTLTAEILGWGGADKDRKIVKLLAAHELVVLTEVLPTIPMSEHVKVIREKFGKLGLEDGVRFKNILGDIERDSVEKTQSNNLV